MADHARKQVREAAVTDLTGLPTTGAHVFTSRVSPLTATEMPGLKIMLREESGDFDAMGTLARTGRLIIEGWLQGGDDIEDDLDQVASEVEAKIYGTTPNLEPLLMNIGSPITSIDVPETDEGVARRTGVVRMLFPLVYRTRTTDPTTIV
jgi:hypothetical protein